MNEENKNKYISYWLLLITFLVSLIIIVGGLTRLTDSGLSITKWDLVTGIFPPITLNDWNELFDLYKKIPEYTLLNSTMTISEFKVIFWWEYVHRLLGRIVGLAYLIPLIYFTYKNYFNKKSLITYYLILLLIIFQGIIGWFMVKSGLSERTDVSHYRLSLHLTFAFIILTLLIWNYLKVKKSKIFYRKNKLPFNLPFVFFLLIMTQISTGALVSGLDAGNIYQTWPLMNQNFFPDDSSFFDLFELKMFETPSLVQFIHRNLAYFIFLLFLLLVYIIFSNKDFTHLRNLMLVVAISLLFQIFLGILTILSGAHIALASMHQIGSIVLVITVLNLIFKDSREY